MKGLKRLQKQKITLESHPIKTSKKCSLYSSFNWSNGSDYMDQKWIILLYFHCLKHFITNFYSFLIYKIRFQVLFVVPPMLSITRMHHIFPSVFSFVYVFIGGNHIEGVVLLAGPLSDSLAPHSPQVPVLSQPDLHLLPIVLRFWPTSSSPQNWTSVSFFCFS